jgi:PAS domain S-box-containing protein
MESQGPLFLLMLVIVLTIVLCWFFWSKYDKIKKELEEKSDHKQLEKVEWLTDHLAREQRLNEELSQREEELTSNEEELRQSLESQMELLNTIQLKEASLKALINNTNDLIFSLDKDYCVVEYNEASQNFYQGMGAPFDKGVHMRKFVTGKNLELAFQILDKTILGEVQSAIFDIVDSSGKKNFFESYYNPIRNDKKEVIGISVMIREVTERIKVVESLKASEEKYSKAFKSSPDSVLITGIKDGRIVELNEGFLAWSGYTREEAEGKTTMELGFWDPTERDYLKQQLQEHGRVIELEVHLKIKSGDIRDCLMSAETMLLGEELCLVSITRDVTYKKRNQELLMELLNTEKQLNHELSQREEELSSSEEELRQSFESQSRLLSEIQLKEANVSALMNNTSDMIYSIDKEYRVIEFNTSMYNFIKGNGALMFKGMHVSEFIPSYNREGALEVMKKAINGEQAAYNFELPSEKGKRYFEGRYNPITNDDKEILGVSCVLREVTETKKAELALKASEEKYSIWFRSSPDAIVVSTIEEGIIIDANYSFLKNLGATKEEVIGKTSVELGFLQNVNDREEIRERVKKNGSVINMELHTQRRSGEKRVVLISAAALVLDGQNCMITTARDVTQLKKAEEEIRLTGDRLKAVINNVPVAIWTMDRNGIITLSEGKALEDMGLKPGEHVGLSAYDLYNEDPEHTNYIKPVIEQGITHYRSDKIKGRYYEEIISPIRNNSDEIIGLIGVSIDVTEIKKKERELKDNESLLNNIINNLPIGLQIFDKDGFSIKMNETQGRLLGLKSFEEKNNKFNAITDPLNVSLGIDTIFQKAFKGETIDNLELAVDFGSLDNSRYQRNDKAWFNLWLYPIFNEKNEVVAIINLLSDVTERKLNEESIKQKNEELVQISQMMADYKLMALRSAMNPHFIFNAMNSIQFFISKNERENALIYLSLFSKLIRNILTATVENKVTIHHEMETLQNYIELENLRFDMKFEVDYEIDEELDIRQLEIPSLLLQPYVENAILHGLYNKSGKGKLKIKILSHNENTVIFVVEDNGIGRKEARKIKQANQLNNHKSVGMVLTKERLEIINKTNNISVDITDLTHEDGSAAGTKIEIYIEI